MSDMLLKFFQHPGFLWVVLAILIPPIIEWLLRRRRRRIIFPAMRFLLDTERPKKIRMQDRILLILRMIIIFFIVMALSRPLLRPEDIVTVSRKDRSVVLLFDATYSNAQRVGNKTSFGVAQRMAVDILSGLPEGVQVAIGTIGQITNVVQDWTADKALLTDKVEALRVSHGSAGIRDGLIWAMDKIKEKSKGKQATAELYIFSDMQAQTWEKGSEAGEGRSVRGLIPKLTERAQVYICATGGAKAVNLFVTRFEPVDKVLAKGVKTEFMLEIQTTGLKEGRSTPARLTFLVTDSSSGSGSIEQKRYTEEFDVPASGMTRKVPYDVLSGGEQVMRVVLEGDDSPLDNERIYLAEVPEAMRVLILDDEGDRPAYDRPSVFWEYATAPPSAPGRERVSAFTVKACNWQEAQKENFADYGVVVLANLRELPQGLVSRLVFYVKEGGSMLAFAGEGIEPYPYEQLHKQGAGPLPAMFKDRQEATGFLRPLLPEAGKLEEAPFKFLRRMTDVAKDQQGTKLVAQTSTGQPVVLSRQFGQGRAVILAMDPGLKWSSLPLAVDYPVFVQELLRAVMGDPNRLVNLKVGDVFSEPVLISAQHVLLKRPTEEKVRLTPERAEGEDLPRISYANTDLRGLYQLEAPAGVLARTRFAVNLNPDEGDMTMWSPADFQKQIARNVRFLSPNENLANLVKSMHALREFAGMLLFLVFLLLLAESFLGMRFGLRKG